MEKTRAQWKQSSPVGTLYLVASDQGLQTILWDAQPVPMVDSLQGERPAIRILAQTVNELTQYFGGQRTQFDVPLDLVGTAFQKKVWGELRRIPYGRTVSYGDIARRLRQAKAFRAVGTANGRNPVCIIVPCHRVIAADGSLGGYSAGLHRKTQLLKLEGTNPV